MNEKKGFIFSYDAVISLLFIVTFLTFLVYYTNSFSYSSMKDYEVIRETTTALDTLIISGEIQNATELTIQGNQAQAESNLRKQLRSLFGKNHKEKLTIEVYDLTGNRLYLIEASYPQTAHTSKKRVTYSSMNVFSTGNYYGIAKLQVWN